MKIHLAAALAAGLCTTIVTAHEHTDKKTSRHRTPAWIVALSAINAMKEQQSGQQV